MNIKQLWNGKKRPGLVKASGVLHVLAYDENGQPKHHSEHASDDVILDQMAMNKALAYRQSKTGTVVIALVGPRKARLLRVLGVETETRR